MAAFAVRKHLGEELEERVRASIKADTSRLVEDIRRHFRNSDEHARELAMTRLDAWVTPVETGCHTYVEQRAAPGACVRYARFQFLKDGRAMGYERLLSYLTLLESHKDGEGRTVGRRGGSM